MTDNYPENFEIEVERDMARKYLRIRWFFSWVLGLLPVSCFIGIMVTAGMRVYYQGYDVNGLLVFDVIRISLSISASGILLLYFTRSHWLAARMAASLQVQVEGSFLRIIQEKYERVDRKLHFRSIVDYAAVDDILMRHFGLMALQMTTTGGGLESTITLIGIKDCLRVRDMLAEIDSMRENA